MPITGDKRKEYDRQRYLRLKEERSSKLATKPIHVSLSDDLDKAGLYEKIQENIRIREGERQERIFAAKERLVDVLIGRGLSVEESTILANEKSRGKFWNMSLDMLRLYLYDRDEYDKQHLDKLRAEGHIV